MIPVTYCYRWQNDDEAVRRENLEFLAKHGVKRIVLTSAEIEKIKATCKKMLGGDKVCTVFTPNAEIVQLCIEKNEYYRDYNFNYV